MKVVWSLILVGSAVLCESSSSRSSNISSSPQRLLLGEMRTKSIDTSGMVCQLGVPHDTEAVTVSYEIPFYYALGTSEDLDFMGYHMLKQRIFTAIGSTISWCWKEEAIVVSSGAGDGGDDRKLQSEQRQQAMQNLRDLGILSVGAGPTDKNVGK
jgi:hypothetical protein